MPGSGVRVSTQLLCKLWFDSALSSSLGPMFPGAETTAPQVDHGTAMTPTRFLSSARWRRLQRGAYAATCLSVAGLVGCSEGPIQPEPEITVTHWVQESGLAAPRSLFDSWGSSASTVWAI